MKKIIYVALMALAAACGENSLPEATVEPLIVQACDVTDPVNDLPWLKSMVDGIQRGGLARATTITMYEYGDSHVFFVDVCCHTCTYPATYYRCDGSAGDRALISDQVSNPIVVWKRKDFKCTWEQ